MLKLMLLCIIAALGAVDGLRVVNPLLRTTTAASRVSMQMNRLGPKTKPTFTPKGSKPPPKKGALPEEVLARTRYRASGNRKVGDEDQMQELWQTFKKCYPNEQIAIEAAKKNSAVFNPQLNSPTKIKGTFALLNERLGKKGAQELILKNPGVLICSPLGLSKESNESILAAADFVEWTEKNRTPLQIVSGSLFAVPLLLIVWKIVAQDYGDDWVLQALSGNLQKPL